LAKQASTIDEQKKNDVNDECWLLTYWDIAKKYSCSNSVAVYGSKSAEDRQEGK
jgi:hypothetical protein